MLTWILETRISYVQITCLTRQKSLETSCCLIGTFNLHEVSTIFDIPAMLEFPLNFAVEQYSRSIRLSYGSRAFISVVENVLAIL